MTPFHMETRVREAFHLLPQSNQATSTWSIKEYVILKNRCPVARSKIDHQPEGNTIKLVTIFTCSENTSKNQQWNTRERARQAVRSMMLQVERFLMGTVTKRTTKRKREEKRIAGSRPKRNSEQCATSSFKNTPEIEIR